MIFYGPLVARDSAARLSATAAKSDARQAVTEVERTRADLERVLMITEALWGILKEQHGYSDEELIRRVAEIDLRDGKLDGQVASSAPKLCPSCQRTLNKRRLNCIYCGEAIQPELFGR